MINLILDLPLLKGILTHFIEITKHTNAIFSVPSWSIHPYTTIFLVCKSCVKPSQRLVVPWCNLPYTMSAIQHVQVYHISTSAERHLYHHNAMTSSSLPEPAKVTLTTTFKGFRQEFSCIIWKCQMCWSAKLERCKADFQNSIPSAVLERCNSVASFLVNCLLHTGHFLLHTGCLKQQSCPAHICKIFQRMARRQPLMRLNYPVTVQAL